MSSWVATWFATLEERSCWLERSFSIILPDFGELVGGSVELSGNCHNARDGGI